MLFSQFHASSRAQSTSPRCSQKTFVSSDKRWGSDPPPFLLLLCKTRSPQPAPPMRLRRGSHTTHAPSTAFLRAPVGALENHGRISPSVHRFSNSPDSHNRDLENSHLSQPRAPALFHPDSHFSYLTYGYYCSLFIYIHTYSSPSVAMCPARSASSSEAAPSFRRITEKGETVVRVP